MISVSSEKRRFTDPIFWILSSIDSTKQENWGAIEIDNSSRANFSIPLLINPRI